MNDLMCKASSLWRKKGLRLESEYSNLTADVWEISPETNLSKSLAYICQEVTVQQEKVVPGAGSFSSIFLLFMEVWGRTVPCVHGPFTQLREHKVYQAEVPLTWNPLYGEVGQQKCGSQQTEGMEN